MVLAHESVTMGVMGSVSIKGRSLDKPGDSTKTRYETPANRSNKELLSPSIIKGPQHGSMAIKRGSMNKIHRRRRNIGARDHLIRLDDLRTFRDNVRSARGF